jgi:NTP pyrophosphatase (non-canonical NTP hydrolase)
VNEDAERERTAEHPLDAELRRALAPPSDAAIALVDRLERQSAEIADLKREAAELYRELRAERQLRHELEREHAGVVRIADALEEQLEEAWSRLQVAEAEPLRRRPPWRRS